MISQSDLIMLVLAFLIGYVQDNTGPQSYHYEDTVVVVDSKYQCPKHCGVDHFHSVYFDSLSFGMSIQKEDLGEKYKPPKTKKKR